MTAKTVLPKFRFTFVIRINRLCKHNFRFWKITFRDIFMDSGFDNTLLFFSGRSRVWAYSFVKQSASTSVNSVWNGIQGSMTVDIHLTWRFWAKFFSFSGGPRGEIWLHLWLIVKLDSLHWLFSTDCWSFRAEGRTISVFSKLWARVYSFWEVHLGRQSSQDHLVESY